MNEIAGLAALSLLLTSATISPAQADGPSDLQQRLDGALKGAKSFVVTTLYPAQAYSATLVYVAPDRSRLAVAVAASTTDVVTIGRTVYSSKNGASFEKSALSADAALGAGRALSAGSVKVTAVRPDVSAFGVKYGAFETSVALGAPVTLTCLYDKKNYRLVRCANADVTQTYNSYNDPQNTVEAPRNAVDAAKIDAPKDVK